MYEPLERHDLAEELGGAFLAGPWRAVELAERGASCLDRWPGWMTALAMHVVATHRVPPSYPAQLAHSIEAFLAEHPPPAGEAEPPRLLRSLPTLSPLPAGRSQPFDHGWPVAEIGSVAEVAEKLELSEGHLSWLADVRGLERTVSEPKLRSYRYRVVPRRTGVPRLLEIPKARLKEVQRWILREILDHVPPHDAALGFTAGRSVLEHARLHSGHEVVLRLDLKDFFASIAARRVFGIFRTLGYPPSLAHVLTGLCTNVVPLSVWEGIPHSQAPSSVQRRFWLGRQLATPHLPQGAPTSPALANLAAFRLDRRLSGLAASFEVAYSRYADDLTFSGPRRLDRRASHLERLVTRIVGEEGFAVNPSKSCVQTAGGRQLVCGLVVNSHPNISRRDYDKLKAILHRAARYGPAGPTHDRATNLRAHLEGRIAWVASLNPERGTKLRRRFDQIDWES
jgi:hypothetical protein